jgi:hypothetical protein
MAEMDKRCRLVESLGRSRKVGREAIRADEEYASK